MSNYIIHIAMDLTASSQMLTAAHYYVTIYNKIRAVKMYTVNGKIHTGTHCCYGGFVVRINNSLTHREGEFRNMVTTLA